MFQARFHSFWVEVFFTNFFPVTSFLHQPSFLYGKPHEYSSLRSFGCSCYPAHRDYATNKFDFKSLHYMFLGYNDKFKGYRCLYPPTSRVYISNHVFFYENLFHLVMYSDIFISMLPLQHLRHWHLHRSLHCEIMQWEKRYVIVLKQIHGILFLKLLICLVGRKWMYRTKLNANGTLNKHKACLVVQGNNQEAWVGFLETYNLIVRTATVRKNVTQCSNIWMGGQENGCTKCFLTWRSQWNCLHVSTCRFCRQNETWSCLPLIQITITLCLV